MPTNWEASCYSFQYRSKSMEQIWLELQLYFPNQMYFVEVWQINTEYNFCQEIYALSTFPLILSWGVWKMASRNGDIQTIDSIYCLMNKRSKCLVEGRNKRLPSAAFYHINPLIKTCSYFHSIPVNTILTRFFLIPDTEKKTEAIEYWVITPDLYQVKYESINASRFCILRCFLWVVLLRWCKDNLPLTDVIANGNAIHSIAGYIT